LVRRFEAPINEAYGPTRDKMRDIFHPELPEVRVVRAVGGATRGSGPGQTNTERKVGTE
jgi:hypothetical protein